MDTWQKVRKFRSQLELRVVLVLTIGRVSTEALDRERERFPARLSESLLWREQQKMLQVSPICRLQHSVQMNSWINNEIYWKQDSPFLIWHLLFPCERATALYHVFRSQRRRRESRHNVRLFVQTKRKKDWFYAKLHMHGSDIISRWRRSLLKSHVITGTPWIGDKEWDSIPCQTPKKKKLTNW